MDEFASIKSTSSVVKIAACLEKIYKKINQSCKNRVAEHHIKEIEFLKTQCKSDNIQLSLMSCQTLVRLVQEHVLEHSNVLNVLLSMLSNSSSARCTAITESAVQLLLLALKEKTAKLKDPSSYRCSYGLKTQQHPLITIIQTPGINMVDVSNKIIGICNSFDKQIKNLSIEYLRPVFLFELCNPQPLPDSKTIWTCLLSLSHNRPEAKALMEEVLAWSRFNNASSCLFTSILVIEAIDYFCQQRKHTQATDLCIYQALLVKQLAVYGVDPRPSLQAMLRVLKAVREHTHDHYNILLVLLAESLHVVSPFYLPDVLRVISFIVVQERCGHKYILNMCLDGIIQWMSQTAFIPADGIPLACAIVDNIMQAGIGDKDRPIISTKNLTGIQARYYHNDIAIAFDLANLIESFDTSEFKSVFAFVDALDVKANTNFCQQLQLFLRALFLSGELLSMDCWFKVYEILLNLLKTNENIAYSFLKTYISRLTNEQNSEILIELLRGLPTFAHSKDNIPMILNTLGKLAADDLPFNIDLYLRLWRVENRTYPFLIKEVSAPITIEAKAWEFNVARAKTLREICREKPTQYCGDTVPLLSNIMNSSLEDANDLPYSLALDGITLLCEAESVNITSTWNAIGNRMRDEKRPRSLKSVLRFYEIVPLVYKTTPAFNQLVDELLDHLWQTITASNANPEHVCAALAALKHYELGVLQTLRHIPPQFRQNVKTGREYTGPDGRTVLDLEQEEIPGECWVQLLQKIRPECADAVAELIAHYIALEVREYRSGLYRRFDGKTEPRKLQGLFNKSILRAVTNYLVTQSRFNVEMSEPHAVTCALSAISQKFAKPIPPLDWSFLKDYFGLSFEARKCCILILKNHLLHSNSARQLMESFLKDFEPNCFEEDLLLLFSLLPEISNGVSLQILKHFAEKVSSYCFKESQLAGFQEGCLFEKFLSNVKYIFTGKCDIPEVLDVFTLIVERYMDSMDYDSKLFERYTEAVAVLHPNAIDGLTTPANWWETPLGKLKKATLIRCYLVLYNTKLPNPLQWLTPIIDAHVRQNDEQTFFFRHLAATLYAFDSDEFASQWIMDLLIQIQALLAESSNKEKLEKALYLLDIFALAVDVLSGCAILLGNVDVIATDRKERFALFPESLQLLCEHIFFKDQEAKIYEFLYNLYKNTAIPDEYTASYKQALICARNNTCFDNKSIWTKYIGLRK